MMRHKMSEKRRTWGEQQVASGGEYGVQGVEHKGD